LRGGGKTRLLIGFSRLMHEFKMFIASSALPFCRSNSFPLLPRKTDRHGRSAMGKNPAAIELEMPMLKLV